MSALIVLALTSVAVIAYNGASPSSSSAQVWRNDQNCTLDHEHTSSTGIGFLDFFTADGAYMPRTHCLVTQQGNTDWFWVWTLVGVNAIVILGYIRIFIFWRRAYLEEEPHDRNTKLMDLAWIFLLCAFCGYVSSIILFFWPAYRLLALMLIPLGFFTWKFASNLDAFKLSLSAKRLSRELNESLHKQNERLEKEIASKTEDLELAKQHADRANKAKSDFLARMSHEIRTPMSAILGYVDLALEEDVSEEQRQDHLRTVRRNTEHLLHIVNDVLDFSKIESGAMTYESISFSIRTLASDLEHLMIEKARSKGIDLSIKVDDAAPDQIRTDPTRVLQILNNLVGNAIKFTQHGSVKVEIAVLHVGPTPSDSILEIHVKDTGIGMTPLQRTRIFTSFSQANANTTRKYGGSGLGLSISRRIARDLGGDLTVDSVPGEGSTFIAYISCKAEDLPEDHTRTTPQSSRATPKDALRGLHILLVEDGDDNARLIMHKLNKIKCRPTRVADGYEALEELHDADARDEPYQLVLMDISMPKLDGIEATRAIREEGLDIPVVMLSAHALQTERDRAFDAGANAYETKPIDFPKLFETCAAVLAHRAKRRAA